MNTQKLSQYLFNGFDRIYVILDGASIPELLTKLYEWQPEYFCLYRGELEPDIAEVAPYIIRITPDTELCDWILKEGWGNHWGIFAQSQYSLAELRKHFRKFLTVHDESGTPLLFRFYDPRVLRTFLPTCTNEELQEFFGIVKNFALEDEDSSNLVSYFLPKGALKINRFEIG
ncbi:MAG TPA: DUF4123 domain-containing protein [Pyrinomonadaceae bacterium]|nr:DUF4123 domain-containing protein [Pyrinomonadaceae bacterium]